MDFLSPFKALSDETRLRLLLVLVRHELNVNELTKLFGMGQSRISRHLRILSDAGLISSRRQGQWTFYRRSTDSDKILALTNSVMGLLESWPEPQGDLSRALDLIIARSRNSKQFFSDLASKKWSSLKAELSGSTDLDALILQALEEKETVADIGCGTGDLLLRLQLVCRHVIGVDHLPAMLEVLNSRLGESVPSLDLRIGDVAHLPLRDGEADALILNMVLHHLPQPDKAFIELNRVTRRGGQLLLVELDTHTREDVAQRFGDVWMGFSEGDLNTWLAEAGWGEQRRSLLNIGLGLKAHFVSVKKTQEIKKES